jgi:cytochrome c556
MRLLHEGDHRTMPSQRYASPTLKLKFSVIAAAIAAASIVQAATPVEIQKERHEHFEALGDAFKAVRDNTKGSPDFVALEKSLAVIEKSAKDLGTWFPKGTGPEAGKTRALPEVWSKPAEFSAAQKLFAEKVAPLAAAIKAKNADGVGAAFKDVGGACKNCHETFRAPE